MECEDLSDLEEGEIFEYECSSPSDSKQNVLGKGEPNFFNNGSSTKWFEYKYKDDSLFFSKQGNCGYINRDLKEKLKTSWNETNKKRKKSVECISSDGEYQSDENKDQLTYSNKKRSKKKYISHMSYGTVEDIMSEIGETISRKSRCSYKRKKSGDFKYNLGKIYSKEVTPHCVRPPNVFSSHFSNISTKRRKKKLSCSDLDSETGLKEEVSRGRRCRRKKKKEVHYHSQDDEEDFPKTTPSKQIRDFDEVRRSLLEKLKKQKAEEESKEVVNDLQPPTGQELENSEIQEVEMLIDCTNYVDNPSEANEGEMAAVVNGNESADDGGEDELDVIQLRLIALASNRKRKNCESLSKDEKGEDNAEGKSDEGSKDIEDGDLDRNELLLRAEALKTALLKKHQKRLNRIKGQKVNGIGSSSDNDVVCLVSALAKTQETVEPKGSEEVISDLKMAVQEDGDEIGEPCSVLETGHDTPINANDVDLKPSPTPKKINGKVRGKRKKKKSFSQPSKENNEKNDILEEDDRTLRSLLLSDLMKKKSLKVQEKKPVLMDSMQATANKPPPLVKAKPVPVKRTALKKINLTKSAAVPVPIIPKPEIQRIIVHLGSEDSSDDEGGMMAASPQSVNSVLEKGNTELTTVSRPVDEMQASYEKSVELLLSQARKKVEGELQTTQSEHLNTPEAVYKHLPPSQRLEYMRLKQKIAERERLRKLKKEVPAVSSTLTPAASLPPEQSSAKEPKESRPVLRAVANQETPAPKNKTVSLKNSTTNLKPSNINGRVANDKSQQIISKIKNSVGTPNKSAAVKLPPNGKVLRNKLLLPSSQALINKLKLLLKKIKIEKCMEENYEKEISKLKNQLSLFEKKKNEQKFKIKKLAEESMKIYQVIQRITNPEQKEEAKKQLNTKEEKREDKKSIVEERQEDKKSTAEERQEDRTSAVEENPSTETKIEISEARSGNESAKELICDAAVESPRPRCDLLEYSSPLDAFNKESDLSERVDPNVIVCQFDLMGVCKDEECSYQHFRTS